MNQEKINRNLQEKDSESSEFQRKVVEYCRKLLKASADRMSEFHSAWDCNAYAYRGYRTLDKDDRDALKSGEPAKLVVPITYAQTQTAISFILSTFSQRENIFEVRGRGPEDEQPSLAISTDLQYQLEKDNFLLKLYFWLLDAWKQGFGVVSCNWAEQYQYMRVANQVPDYSLPNLFSRVFGAKMPMKTEEAVQEVLSYQGNQVRNISPYAFYPDPSVTIANFQQGMFVGVEEELPLLALESLEGDVYYGTDKIPKTINRDVLEERPRRITGPFNKDEGSNKDILNTDEKKEGTVVRLEIELTLSEKEATRLFGGNLGSETKPCKWLVTIANDQKLVRFEKKTNLHGRYGFEVFEYSPDHDSFYNPGLADTISELQGVVTFLFNSHIVNIRKVIANRFIANVNQVHEEDILSGSLLIRTKGATADINRVLKQLDVSDVTKGNVDDIGALNMLIQLITGVNENALGQYSSGRRSATEARNVNAGSASRLKMHGMLSWMQGIQPLGMQYLANTRQWRTREVYESIVGELAMEAPYEQVILADPNRLAGGYDFIPYDATLPTDRQFQAGVLQELFGMLVSNPNTIQLVNKDPMKLLSYIAKLYNIKNLRDFDLSQLPQPAVVPNQEAADAAGAGAAPVDMMGEEVLRGLVQ